MIGTSRAWRQERPIALVQSGGRSAGDNLPRGLALMAAAVALFALTDATAKRLTEFVHPFEVVWSRFFFYALCLAPFALRRAAQGSLASSAPRLQLARGCLMLLSTTFATVAIMHVALVDMTAIGFLGPLFAVALSIPILGERVGVRRWSAVIVGFVGVLIVVRPGGAAFNPWATLFVIGSGFWALGFVITRKVGARDDAVVTLVWTTAVGLLGSSLALPLVWTTPDPAVWLLMALNGAGNLFGQYLAIRAAQLAAPSVIAPLIYTQLVWSITLGWFMFGSWPDQWTFVGAAIIVAAGLYVWHRERVLRHG
jgi:drug/metabolite transporter (DMT)-like permease